MEGIIQQNTPEKEVVSGWGGEMEGVNAEGTAVTVDEDIKPQITRLKERRRKRAREREMENV